MSRLRYNRVEARHHLGEACPHMNRAVSRLGPLKLRVARNEDLFTALASAIIYQQLSGKAAATIYGRFEGLFKENWPEALAARKLSIPKLRSVGLSQSKALSVLDLAQKTSDGSLPGFRSLARMDDETVIEKLVQVRGIGPWSAQMLLIFNLGRPDVMPATDLGVQKGIQIVYGLEALPPPKDVMARTAHLAPYRSAACWYFWRAADTVLKT